MSRKGDHGGEVGEREVGGGQLKENPASNYNQGQGHPTLPLALQSNISVMQEVADVLVKFFIVIILSVIINILIIRRCKWGGNVSVSFFIIKILFIVIILHVIKIWQCIM